MSLLYKKGEELQRQKDQMSVAASLFSNQTSQQALDRQKQIKENHIGSMQTPIGIEGILQQATHILLHKEPKMSPTLPHPHLQDLPIGGRLTHYISEWQKIGADTLVSRGIKAYQLHKEFPEILARNKCIPSQNRSKQ
ncbi:MAG: hypothetical protein EZS28_036576, partial [Streblomastix strix]